MFIIINNRNYTIQQDGIYILGESVLHYVGIKAFFVQFKVVIYLELKKIKVIYTKTFKIKI